MFLCLLFSGHEVKSDANGATTTYSYDGLNRLLKKIYPDNTTETFTYDPKGNILTAANANISYTMSYDTDGRITSVTDSNHRTVRYQYDKLGNKTQLTYPDATSVNYNYDTANRLKSIENGETFTYGYDKLGRRATLSYPNGVTATYAYDSAGRLTALSYKTARGEIIDSFGYTLDKIGNRLTKTEPDTTHTYDYDTLYRLTEAVSSAPGYSGNTTGKGKGIPNATNEQKEFYTYDMVGNRLTSDKGTYTYNKANQLLTNSGTYTYDKNGNLISKVDGATTISYSYDYENRLTKVTKNENGAITTSEYQYDPFGRRIEKTITDNDGTATTTYVYDSQNIIEEYDASGNPQNRYIQGLGIDEHLAVVTGKNEYYYHADGLGSITALTNSSGKNVQTYEYDSFGNLKDQKNRIKQPYTFTGREWDKEAGLYYYRARYYDAEAGRFISKDPIGFRGGINLYVYTKDNPITWADPSGLKTYMCKKYLHALGGSGQRSGPDIWGNPFYHQYICVITASGEEICGGQDRSGGAWSPGKPSEDFYSQEYCEQTDPDNECLEQCLVKAIESDSRPFYGLFGPGTNCQEWANDTYSACKSKWR